MAKAGVRGGPGVYGVDSADAWLVDIVGVADPGSLGVEDSLLDDDEAEGMVSVRDRRLGFGRFSEGRGMKLDCEAERSLDPLATIAGRHESVDDDVTDESGVKEEATFGSGWLICSGDMATSSCSTCMSFVLDGAGVVVAVSLSGVRKCGSRPRARTMVLYETGEAARGLPSSWVFVRRSARTGPSKGVVVTAAGADKGRALPRGMCWCCRLRQRRFAGRGESSEPGSIGGHDRFVRVGLKIGPRG